MKVLYTLISPSHKRCIESFKEHPRLEQLVAGPMPINSSNLIVENYSWFNINKVRYFKNSDIKSLVQIVSDFKPDVYVQTDFSKTHDQVKTITGQKYKRVYISHGLIGNHVGGHVESKHLNADNWKGMDLYCGDGNEFESYIKQVSGADDNQIILGSLPQLDLLHDKNYYNSWREKILNKTKMPNAKKVILFIGFCCQDRIDFEKHNADYFRTAIELGKIAKKNNWLVMIKPRQTHEEMIKFLKTHKWGKEFLKDYLELKNNSNIHFIGPAANHIYRYYFIDCFVVNGCSTVEIEACAIQKPLFIVRTEAEKKYDPFSTTSLGAAKLISKIDNLESALIENEHNINKQSELLKQLNITFDGCASKRIQDILLEL